MTDGTEYLALSTEDKLRTLLDEERELDFDAFDLEDAWALGSWLRSTALDRGLGIACAVAFGEQRVFHAATPGSGAVNDAWLDRKFRVVRHFGHSTLAVRTDYERGGSSFAEAAALDPLTYQAAGGGFPLRLRGALIGTVGVSGLEMHHDHALVVEALRAHH
ncbi:heme-degrading domain-containing protein [Curtobacterium sp. ISL-83]|uniref:heme-degrading domain-containing protein n=1 Tax=Curtobacterium sp. ISL-83 TaxID=2819145 RepID=UPI001BE5050A|nr:heme-degrading domain-containing protein [Curtobacterium sp. ISL-83]MBT2503844.1 heme-degrading domain-containing protein [Curtobacterium sp. ISL-83]